VDCEAGLLLQWRKRALTPLWFCHHRSSSGARFLFCFVGGTGFELRASHLQSRYSTTSAIPPIHLLCLFWRWWGCLGLALSHDLPNLSLLSSLDYRREPPVPAWSIFLAVWRFQQINRDEVSRYGGHLLEPCFCLPPWCWGTRVGPRPHRTPLKSPTPTTLSMLGVQGEVCLQIVLGVSPKWLENPIWNTVININKKVPRSKISNMFC
jgi:hypothetical protein